MEYKVVIGRDAAVWFVQFTNVPGLALEDPSLDGLLRKLPDVVAWLLQDQQRPAAVDVPFEVLLVRQERAHLAP